MHVSYRTVQSSRFQRGADGHVNRVCADGMRNETSCGEADAVDGVQGSPPQAAGGKGTEPGSRWKTSRHKDHSQTGGQENGLAAQKWAASIAVTESS